MYLPSTELCPANVTYFYQYSFYVAKITYQYSTTTYPLILFKNNAKHISTMRRENVKLINVVYAM